MTVLTETRSFIEAQFPVSKVSKESYKERKAVAAQTLTGLGKWWGRKPLVLVRAALLGLLMPTSDDPKRDRDIFLKIMTMGDEGMWRRMKDNIPYKQVYALLTEEERECYFRPLKPEDRRPYLKRGTREEKAQMREEVQRLAFNRLSYDERLSYCYRPEEISGPADEAWSEINAHLGTDAHSLPELVQQLSQRQFGHIPQVGDAFAGGGNIPFEAARLGCDVFASDLNPVAALLSWASLNIVGGDQRVAEQVWTEQKAVYEAVDNQLTKWQIEHNERGWRADAYLYCLETQCPECDVTIPLAPSWLIAPKPKVIAVLELNENTKSYDIEIRENVSRAELKAANNAGTVVNNSLNCPACRKSTPLDMIRGDRRSGGGSKYGLRMWDRDDVVPRPDDTFQERLYCIRWVEGYVDEKDELQTRRHYRSVTDADRRREQKVLNLLRERFDDWQEKGYVPSRRIEPGDKTDEPIRTRGWTHWHHLFNPRQLLTCGLVAKTCNLQGLGAHGALLLGRIINNNSRLSRWKSSQSGGIGGVVDVFSNQALNTLYNYGCRGLELHTSLLMDIEGEELPAKHAIVEAKDCRAVDVSCDIWITDPPYADAVNYHELSEFFLAWYANRIEELFPEWYTDSKRALAITGSEQAFRRDMVRAYRNLAAHMPEDGLQIVMFTHQDASVWADVALILWAAGLRVTAAWTVATETDSALKQGNYVQGTVLLVLRKRMGQRTAFEDEIVYLIEEEVQAQLDAMRALDEDEADPSFDDTDYQLAAYAAALRVLTQYDGVEGWDIERELARPRGADDPSPIERVIEQAVKIAADHLIPEGLDPFVWKTLTPPERLYLKGLELEAHDEFRTGAYQELARGFGVADYKSLFASSRANRSRFKNASEFGTKMLGGDGFESSNVRQALMAIREAARSDDAQQGRNWLRGELPDYWPQRKRLIAILRYLATMRHASEHWAEDGRVAALVAAAVEHDHT